VSEEAQNEPTTIVPKGIDKHLDVINVDLLEADAKSKLLLFAKGCAAVQRSDVMTIEETTIGLGTLPPV
jgi:hypothetical protein